MIERQWPITQAFSAITCSNHPASTSFDNGPGQLVGLKLVPLNAQLPSGAASNTGRIFALHLNKSSRG
jgi:hypothetical protein